VFFICDFLAKRTKRKGEQKVGMAGSLFFAIPLLAVCFLWGFLGLGEQRGKENKKRYGR
jgi:hypothetical protein